MHAARGGRAIIGAGVEPAVFDHVETGTKRVDARQHVLGVTALHALRGAPLRAFGGAPRRAGSTDGISL
jgi:hypothetical protein